MMLFNIPFHLNLKRKLIFISFICGITLFLILVYTSRDCSDTCPYESSLSFDRITFDSFHCVQHFSEFVCPQNFRNLADWVYGWPDGVFDEKLDITTKSGYYIAPCLPRGSIIFVKTDYLDQFFGKVYPYLIYEFVLITAQGDASAPGPFLPYLTDPKSKIIHWFAQNAEIHSTKSKKFTHIPIGINCYEMANAIRTVHKQNPNHTFASVFGGKDEPRQYIHPLDITHKVLNESFGKQLLLLNFQRLTDPTGIRLRVWEMLCDNNSNFTFVVCIDKPDGVDISSLLKVYPRNRQYPFWLSPRGNGLDCHRTWEALYLDVIPIVWNSTLYSLYLNLPVIVINDWRQITEQFLRTKLQEIAANKVQKPSVYRFEKLRFSFWRRLILNKSRHSHTATKRKNQCWRIRTTTKSSWLTMFLSHQEPVIENLFIKC